VRVFMLLSLPALLAVACGDSGTEAGADATTARDDAAADATAEDAVLGDAADASAPPTSAEIACAKFIACTGTPTPPTGQRGCLETVNRLATIDWAQETFLITFLRGGDVPHEAALSQNLSCVAQAATCTEVLACLNGGTAVTDCTPPADYFRGRQCQGESTLTVCSGGIQSRIDCAAFGQTCRETAQSSTKTIASCSQPGAGSGSPMHVTCSGSAAAVVYLGCTFTFDCALFGGTCAEGTYTDWLDLRFCVGWGAEICTGEYQPNCSGDSLLSCVGGSVASADCTTRGMSCAGHAGNVACAFPGCSPTSTESCAGGAIGYCGPRGPSTLACSDLGFSGCAASSGEAWCTP
jgi:hypothetical protein